MQSPSSSSSLDHHHSITITILTRCTQCSASWWSAPSRLSGIDWYWYDMNITTYYALYIDYPINVILVYRLARAISTNPGKTGETDDDDIHQNRMMMVMWKWLWFQLYPQLHRLQSAQHPPRNGGGSIWECWSTIIHFQTTPFTPFHQFDWLNCSLNLIIHSFPQSHLVSLLYRVFFNWYPP